ncbi:hypothetical protein [Pareuzebyella sediminis]|uniref:hypothetical protein n=1 Tax=Pareuzebyella sediminis TaxID=2607998 RepID=UPI0011EC2602|nr:hypothetical protein [Pareuzebyella sediminis]
MKKILLGLAVLPLMLGTACKAVNSAKGQQTNNDMASSERVDTEDEVNSGQDTSSNRVSTVEAMNGSTGGNSNVNQNSAIESTNEVTDGKANLDANNEGAVSTDMDYSQMYIDLGMTDDQIRNFEMEMENFQSVQNNSPNGEMMGTLSTERDRQLENILTPEQFEEYQHWKEEN